MKRYGLSIVLSAILLVSPGCITAALWENHDGDDTAWATAGRAALTPLTVAADSLILGGALWAAGEGRDDHRHSGCCCD